MALDVVCPRCKAELIAIKGKDTERFNDFGAKFYLWSQDRAPDVIVACVSCGWFETLSDYRDWVNFYDGMKRTLRKLGHNDA